MCGQYADATSKMVVIMARGYFRLCELIKDASQKPSFFFFFSRWMYCPRLRVATFCFLFLKLWDSCGAGKVEVWVVLYERNCWVPWFLTNSTQIKVSVSEKPGYSEAMPCSGFWNTFHNHLICSRNRSLVGKVWVVTMNGAQRWPKTW